MATRLSKPSFAAAMQPAALRAWQAHMGYTYEAAAQALGISRSGFAKLLAGDHPIDKRTALACAAIAAGIKEWGDSSA